MKKNKAVFLDRDGTINYDYGYVHKKDKLKFLPGVIESLERLNNAGYLLIIITNQSGIGRGYFTLEEYNEFNNYMLEKLKEQGINITKVYYCPHTDNDNCNCRKPKLGLFYQAIDEYSYLLTIQNKDYELQFDEDGLFVLSMQSDDQYEGLENLKYQDLKKMI